MRVLTSQLLLLEANMRVKEHKIDALLNQRDRTIGQQQERIDSLEKQLLLLATRKAAERPDSLPIHQRSLTGDDSLDDSDSAVVIEDGPDSHSPGYKDQDPRNSSVTLIFETNSIQLIQLFDDSRCICRFPFRRDFFRRSLPRATTSRRVEFFEFGADFVETMES